MAFSPAARPLPPAGFLHPSRTPEATVTAILTPRPTHDVEHEAEQGFASACTLLTEARWSQAVKDTPAARLQVELCRARVDALLDDWNDTRAALD